MARRQGRRRWLRPIVGKLSRCQCWQPDRRHSARRPSAYWSASWRQFRAHRALGRSRLEVEIVRTQGRWQATLSTRGEQRRLEGESCRAVMEALTVVLALAADPARLASSAPPQSPPTTPSAASPATLAADSPRPPSGFLRWVLASASWRKSACFRDPRSGRVACSSCTALTKPPFARRGGGSWYEQAPLRQARRWFVYEPPLPSPGVGSSGYERVQPAAGRPFPPCSRLRSARACSSRAANRRSYRSGALRGELTQLGSWFPSRGEGHGGPS